MPVTDLQKKVLALLTEHRSAESHLAGATGLNLSPESERFSHDLDYFHSSETLVAEAYGRDKAKLADCGFKIETVLSQPGFIRAVVSSDKGAVRVDWAHDSSWRFMPPVYLNEVGFVLHPVDLAVNKVLALAGRDEPRDLIDTLFVHKQILSLGALIWAACGKDPGMSPAMMLELLRRKGKLREEDLKHLDMKEKVDLTALRQDWQLALSEAKKFVDFRPPDEAGCLYVDVKSRRFVAPKSEQIAKLHWATQGGVLPAIRDFRADKPDELAKRFFAL